MTENIATKKIKVFGLIWLGQLVSLFGSAITGFAFGIWVYQRTGSVTQFALISLFTTLPGIIISPISGALIDRWDRRFAMIINDIGAGLVSIIILILLFSELLQVWHIYLGMGAISFFNAFQWPAYAATTTLLVPKKHLGRASGLVQFADAGIQILSPLVAGVLISTINIQGLLIFDIASFIFSLLILLFVRFPKPVASNEGSFSQGSLMNEAAYGLKYISARPGLLSLLVFFVANNFVTGVVSVAVTPLVLAFASVSTLGAVLSVGGVGMLIGSLLMSIWGGGKKQVINVLFFSLLSGLSLILTGLRPSIPVFFFTAFFYFFGLPFINASSQVIWQSKVPTHLQGRVFAVRRALAWGSLPLAYILTGPLVDLVFGPSLAIGGPLSGSLGKITGTGPGYGIALLFAVMGISSALIAVGGYLYSPLRLMEEILPDIDVFPTSPEPKQNNH